MNPSRDAVVRAIAHLRKALEDTSLPKVETISEDEDGVVTGYDKDGTPVFFMHHDTFAKLVEEQVVVRPPKP